MNPVEIGIVVSAAALGILIAGYFGLVLLVAVLLLQTKTPLSLNLTEVTPEVLGDTAVNWLTEQANRMTPLGFEWVGLYATPGVFGETVDGYFIVFRHNRHPDTAMLSFIKARETDFSSPPAAYIEFVSQYGETDITTNNAADSNPWPDLPTSIHIRARWANDPAHLHYLHRLACDAFGNGAAKPALTAQTFPTSFYDENSAKMRKIAKLGRVHINDQKDTFQFTLYGACAGVIRALPPSKQWLRMRESQQTRKLLQQAADKTGRPVTPPPQ